MCFMILSIYLQRMKLMGACNFLVATTRTDFYVAGN